MFTERVSGGQPMHIDSTWKWSGGRRRSSEKNNFFCIDYVFEKGSWYDSVKFLPVQSWVLPCLEHS